MASSYNDKKRKNKTYYKDFSRKNKCGVLKAGLKGILLTCNGYEKQCVREAYNLLNEYADKLYGPEFKDFDEKKTDSTAEDQLKIELCALKAEKKNRRFHQNLTKVKNIIFIEANVFDTSQLVHAIFEDMKETGEKKTRYILKMLPILSTCKCNAEDFKKCLNTIIEEKYSDQDCLKLSFKVECKIRNNSGVDSADFVWYSRELIGNIRKNWVPTLCDPDIIISISILQSVCCIGILKNYKDFKKYNLAEMASLQTLTKKYSDSSTDQNSVKSIKCEEKVESPCAKKKCVFQGEVSEKINNKKDEIPLKEQINTVPNDIEESNTDCDIAIFSGL